jgi:hypothetical protein
MVDGMYESFVIESLQNGMIMSSPFLSWYTVVLWMVMSAVISNNVLCPLYNGIRNDLLNCLDWLPNDCHLDLNLLIVGNSTLTNEQNELILKKVFDILLIFRRLDQNLKEERRVKIIKI